MSSQPRVAISEDFLTAFAAIPRAQQKKVTEFVTKFRHDPQSSGINYEKINDACDPNFRSVRVGQDYRGIILKPQEGNIYILLWVAKHDDAYDWARRHECRIHPETGSLQLLDVSLLATEANTHETQSVHVDETPLFTLRDREIARLGVPAELIAKVKALMNADELEAIEAELPQESFEALYLLAAGTPLDEIVAEYAATPETVNTADFVAALELDQSRRRFYVVEGELELHEMLEAPLEKWRVFLHPTQRRLVERQWNGPVRVLGSAGTGKTVVAMHRARWLATHVANKPDQKVLFTTFTANLAIDIEHDLRKICSADEMKRIEVINIDAWISRFLKQQKYPHEIVYDNHEKYRIAWERAMQRTPTEFSLPERFYREEWLRVILPQRVTERSEYFRASRVGRGVPLTRKQRAAVWPVFEEICVQMHQLGVRTMEDATHDAIDILERNKLSLPYRSVIVDEAQDMGPEVMTLLRKLVPANANDLFIVGDGHQRIYRRRFALSQCGIEIRGRSSKLRINYRTTEETYNIAVAVLEGHAIDDLDGNEDSLDGYRSLLHGEAPIVKGFETIDEEVAWIAEQLEAIKGESEGALADTCVVARTQGQLDAYEKALRSANLDVVRLTRRQADAGTREGVRMATMHRVKGLEFRHVFIAGASKDVIPLRSLIEGASDEIERVDSELIERGLLHVSMSRAIQRLYITYFGSASPYLT